MQKVPIVDAAMIYQPPNSDEKWLLIVRNGLFVQSMDHNLACPFIMREAGLEVSEVAKQHCEDPTIEDHSIYDSATGLRIQLELKGIFSSFPTRALTQEEKVDIGDFIDGNRVVELSPKVPRWDPNDEYYAQKEASYLDSNGDLAVHVVEPRPKTTLVEAAEVSSLYDRIPVASVSAVQEVVDSACMSFPEEFPSELEEEAILSLTDDPIAMISAVDPLLNEAELHKRLCNLELQTSVGLSAGCMEVSGLDDEDYLFTKIGHKLGTAAATISAVAAGNPAGVSPTELAKCWRISHADAVRTINATTHLIQHNVNGNLSRNFGTSDRALRYRRIKSIFFMDTLVIGKNAHSVRGYKYVQVFASDKGFVYVYFMESVTEIATALRNFMKEVGVPDTMVADPHPNHKDQKVRSLCLEVGTKLRLLEESTQWANFCERIIGILKESTRKDIREVDAPMTFWCYAMERRVAIMNLTAKNDFKLRGANPYSVTFAETGDISNICHFGFFEWCYYRDNTEGYPNMRENLGRCLGPTKNEGNEMAQSILTKKGTVVIRRTLRKLTAHEKSPTNGVETHKRRQFMKYIHERFGDSTTLPVSRMSRSQRKKGKRLEVIPEENEVDDSCGAPTLESLLADDPDNDPGHDDPFKCQSSPDGDDYVPYEDSAHGPLHMPEADYIDAEGNPIMQQAFTDKLINIEVTLPNGDEAQALGKVLRRSVDESGRVRGKYDDNPFYNTLTYDVQFADGTVKEFQANTIAQNVLAQADMDGHYSIGFKIVGHKMEGDAVRKDKRFINRRDGTREMRKTTVGWKLLVQWKDGTRQWIPLADMKESNPVDVAEYAVSRNIDDEAAFAWWVHYVLKKKKAIIAAVKARGKAKKTSHKFGIEVPRDMWHALQIDRDTGTTFWKEALDAEMYKVGGAIVILDEGEEAPPTWKPTSGHLVFDVKMDYTRKARWVKDGHRTPDPETCSYAGVVSRESVRIMLTYAAVHGLNVFAGDIRNAYLQAPTSEKHYIICGPEFGLENEGRVGLIKRALYGGKVAGRDFWYHLRSAMESMGFTPSKGDPDVWMRKARRHSRAKAANFKQQVATARASGSGDSGDPYYGLEDSGRGGEYYEYVLLYVDDVLVISDNAEAVLRDEIGSAFELKEESIGPPGLYLGGRIQNVELDDGTKCWGYGSSQYVQNSVKNVEDYYMKKYGRQLPAKASTPTKSGYRPEIDASRELNPDESSYFHQLIGILRWIVELGRVDIYTEVSMLSSCLALPREGHLEQVFHIFAYLKKHHNALMVVFDPREPDIEFSEHFPEQDWSYSTMGRMDMKEELPPDMPTPLGNPFVIRAYVDSDHAGDQITRRSRTGFIVYLNGAPIYWKSAKQTSCETSTFGSEFVAMKQCCEYLRGLRYKLRMLGIPVNGPAFIFGDNQSVLANTTNPGSQLKKKSNAICYHYVREGCARKEWITAYIKSEYNVADLLTKPLPSGEKRFYFVKMILNYLAGKDDDS